MIRAVRRRSPVWAGAATLCILFASPAPASEPPPIAGAFVFPVGDELSFGRAAPGEPAGFYVSSKYLAVRRKGKRNQRLHYGVDLANGRGGCAVRAIASGVVVVSDGNALVKYRKKQRVRVSSVVNGKRVRRWVTRYRTGYRWRTGWGNRVVIRHVLPDGEVILSLYAHLKPRSVRVKVGQVVSAGQVLARVGRTGRASAPHLHLEIRRSLPDPATTEPVEAEEATASGTGDSTTDVGGPAETERGITMSANGTMDPMAFLERHVLHFDDLPTGGWESRYAEAASLDGILPGEGGHFEPGEDIRRVDFYGALVRAFQFELPPEPTDFATLVHVLARNGILDPSAARNRRPDDHVSQSDALELLLRCLDRGAAMGRCLAGIAPGTLCSDFNREFAGPDAARKAEQDARAAARAETSRREKEARARYQRDLKRARKTGRKTHVRLARVKPVAPTYTLDAGFDRLAASHRELTRAEAALLVASAVRLAPRRLSALERAARRTDATAASG